jgi:8-oxo-dGTP pyrophosphatase MutT (NUDIX family)
VSGGPVAVLDRIAAELGRREPRGAAPGSYEAEAAVSLLLRPAADARGVEFLAIKRAESAADPWSGHMALPGGRREQGDGSLWATAVRETREEVGVDVATVGRLLGRLDDVTPSTRRIPAIAIRPFVVAVPAGQAAATSAEVERAVWVPLGVLVEDRHRGTFRPGAGGGEYPAIEYGGHVIWGLTYRILSQFAEVLRQIGYRGGRG